MGKGEKPGRTDAPVRLLPSGSSLTLAPYITDIDVTLYRPFGPITVEDTKNDGDKIDGGKFEGSSYSELSKGDNIKSEGSRIEDAKIEDSSGEQPSKTAPLFFDTTSCLFYERGNKVDYVATGRSMTDSRGIQYKHHVVATGNEVNPESCITYNLGSTTLMKDSDGQFPMIPPGGVPMAPGDGLVIQLKKIDMSTGVLICASLFSPYPSAENLSNLFFLVRRAKGSVPIAIIPLIFPDDVHKTCISIMLRKSRQNGEVNWELVSLGELIEPNDVTSVVHALQTRGLGDPLGYFCETSATSGADQADSTADSISNDSTSSEESEVVTEKPFKDLLNHIPRVTREGRRQYNVGRSTVCTALASDESSDADETLDDALRAVVPKFTNRVPVRYGDREYNIGSRTEALTSHYVTNRERYGVEFSKEKPGNPSAHLNSGNPFQQARSACSHSAYMTADRFAEVEFDTANELPPEFLSPTTTVQRHHCSTYRRLTKAVHSAHRKGRSGSRMRSASRRKSSSHRKKSRGRSGSYRKRSTSSRKSSRSKKGKKKGSKKRGKKSRKQKSRSRSASPRS